MMKTVVVLGGGISGLAAAWRLSHRARGLQVVLVEGSSRVGGWMQSVRTEEGAVLELGPRSLRTAGAAGRTTLSLVEEVGLAGEVLAVPPSHKGVSRRLIFTAAHGLVELPSSASWLFQTRPPFTRPLLPAVLAEVFLRSKRKSSEDESVYDFVARRLGKEIADYVIDPMCRGIFAGSAHRLSIRSAFPVIHQYETNHGSIVRGALLTKSDPLPDSAGELVKQAVGEKWAIYSLLSGLESLPRALHTALRERGVQVSLGQPCTALHFTGHSAQEKGAALGGMKQLQVMCEDLVLEADHIISALPSHVLSGLLPHSLSPLSHHLLTIPSVTVGVVCLEFKGRVLPPEYEERVVSNSCLVLAFLLRRPNLPPPLATPLRSPDAFGYLVPSHQPASILGVVFDSSTFPEHNRPDQPSTRCTVMLGGEWFDELGDDPGNTSTDDVVKIALDSLRDHLGVTDEPSNIVARIHKNCIAQYRLGHSQKLSEIESIVREQALPLSLVGVSYRGVSVNDCIHNSFNTVDELLNERQIQ